MIPAPLTPEFDDRSGHALAPLAVADAEGRPVLALVVQATFALFPDLAGRAPPLAPVQQPIPAAGEHVGEPGRSSLRREPETAWFKPGTDLVLLGHAQAPAGEPVAQIDAGLRVGAVQKLVRVYGDRAWTDTAGGLSISGPKPFLRMPLVWERAFGGVDAADPQRRFEPRNPVGCGYVAPGGRLAGTQRMPNLEDPTAPLRRPGDRPLLIIPGGPGMASIGGYQGLRRRAAEEERRSDSRGGRSDEIAAIHSGWHCYLPDSQKR